MGKYRFSGKVGELFAAAVATAVAGGGDDGRGLFHVGLMGWRNR